MTSERVRRLVVGWVRLYTRGLSTSVAERRIQEIVADMHDQVAEEVDAGTGDRQIALHILLRMMRGSLADVSWRITQAGQGRRRGRPSLAVVGRNAVKRTTALGTVLVVAGVLLATFIMSGLLFAPVRSSPHPGAVAVWVFFGAGLGAVARKISRATALASAGLLGLVAVVDFATPLLAVLGSSDVGWIARSQYTWIAIAVLASSGLIAGPRPASGQEASDPASASASAEAVR